MATSPQEPLSALLAQGRSLHQAGQVQQAEVIYRQILNRHPSHPEAMHLLGVLAHQGGNNDLARQLIAQSLALNPGSADYHHNYAEVCLASGLPSEAERASRQAIALAPAIGIYHCALGRALRDQGRLSEAIASGQRAIELDPQTPTNFSNLANALGDARRFDEAIACYRRALALDPGSPTILSGLGTTLAEMGRIDDAIAMYGRALEHSDFPDAHWNRSLLRLLKGNFQSGWDEFEWRWQCPSFPSARLVTSKPQWNGLDAPGQTILLFGEQGAGDTIQFIRYAPLVARQCTKTVLVCAPELKPLLEHAPGVSAVCSFEEPPPAFDQHVPLLSLPRLFKTELTSILAQVPYIQSDPARVQRWRRRLGETPERRIGLAWAGRPSHPNDRNRSMRLADLAPLASVPGIRWISLQKGPAAAEASAPPHGWPILDLSNELADYAETAAVIANLDLLISVDTSVVHLAGAMGTPVWVLLPMVPDWRWLLECGNSPWYPTIRLFRQPVIGDWESVVERIAAELQRC